MCNVRGLFIVVSRLRYILSPLVSPLLSVLICPPLRTGLIGSGQHTCVFTEGKSIKPERKWLLNVWKTQKLSGENQRNTADADVDLNPLSQVKQEVEKERKKSLNNFWFRFLYPHVRQDWVAFMSQPYWVKVKVEVEVELRLILRLRLIWGWGWSEVESKFILYVLRQQLVSIPSF